MAPGFLEDDWDDESKSLLTGVAVTVEGGCLLKLEYTRDGTGTDHCTALRLGRLHHRVHEIEVLYTRINYHPDMIWFVRPVRFL